MLQNSWQLYCNVYYLSCSTPGIVLVHDLTNRKSHQNLQKWLAEVLNREGGSKKDEFDPEHFVGSTQVSNMFTIAISNIWLRNSLIKWVRQPSELEQLFVFFTAEINLFSDVVCPFKHPCRQFVWYSHYTWGLG